jgi:signal transduction histidine kinase
VSVKKSVGVDIQAWVLPFIIFFLATVTSLFCKTPGGAALFYLPIPLSVVLIQWWGPKIIPGLLLNSFLTLIIWDSNDFSLWPVLATHESATAIVSWFLFKVKFKGKVWLPDIQQTLYFILLGILIPVTLNAIYVLLFSRNAHILTHTGMVWAADFASSFTISLPLLYFATPILERLGIIPKQGSSYAAVRETFRTIRANQIEVVLSVVTLSVITIYIPIERYWFLYGLFTIYVAIRFGFGNALLANGLVFTFTYLIPLLLTFGRDLSWALESNLINIHLGMIMLSVAACITGRVISDLRNTKYTLNLKFSELERAHWELDRFVYSASHDLSAPIKSVLGLIHVSRLEPEPTRQSEYIDKIERSVHKLEWFIHEIIDYSKNSRSVISIQQLNLLDEFHKTLDELRETPGFDRVTICTAGLKVKHVFADPMRLRIVMNNIVSNAICHQKTDVAHEPRIWIRAGEKDGGVILEVEDNGQGIPEEFCEKIFRMFFRGNPFSSGSGLGLYIAKDAIEKMNGKIDVTSVPGKGSTFIVQLPNLRDPQEVSGLTS